MPERLAYIGFYINTLTFTFFLFTLTEAVDDLLSRMEFGCQKKNTPRITHRELREFIRINN